MARAPTALQGIEYGAKYGAATGGAIQKSQYLANALEALQANAQSNIRTPAALASNLLADAIIQHKKGKADSAAVEGVAAQRKGILDKIAPLLGGGQQAPQASAMADFIDPMSGQPRIQAPQPQAPQQPQGPVPYTDPRWAQLGVEAGMGGMGAEVAPAIDWAKTNAPDVKFDRGFGYNAKDGSAMGGFHPELGQGQAMGPGGQVQNLPGAVGAAAQMAGGVAGAQEGAKAPFNFVQAQNAQGQPVTASSAYLAGREAGGWGPMVGQSAAQTEADKIAAAAGANANVGLPQSQASSQQALDLIDSLKADPQMKYRTGMVGVLPSMPGTGGVGFDAKAKQLTGKVFLEAYAGLKGGGQITEVEGKKAQEAVARLDRAQSQEDYTAALDDLRNVISTGMQRAQAQPQRLQPNAAQAQGGMPQGMPDRGALEAELRKRKLIR